jgi:succinoglycan biosynthesis transport protein ExoP
MEAASDADSAAAMVDAALLVVEWGRTDIDLIADCLAGTHAVPPRLIGAVLNKVELRNMRRYGDYGRARGASYAPVRIGSAV